MRFAVHPLINKGPRMKQIMQPYWLRIKHCCFLWSASWAGVGGEATRHCDLYWFNNSSISTLIPPLRTTKISLFFSLRFSLLKTLYGYMVFWTLWQRFLVQERFKGIRRLAEMHVVYAFRGGGGWCKVLEPAVEQIRQQESASPTGCHLPPMEEKWQISPSMAVLWVCECNSVCFLLAE